MQTLKYLHTFTMIRDDMTLCQCTVSASQITIAALGIHNTASTVKKANLYEPFQTVTFHHDAPNSHVPGINFLEFLVHALSITSYHSS